MKKILLTSLLVLGMVAGVYAAEFAIDKGSINVGGSVGFYLITPPKEEWVDFWSVPGVDINMTEETSMSVITFSPEVAYFVIKGLMVGPVLDIETTSRETETTGEALGTSITETVESSSLTLLYGLKLGYCIGEEDSSLYPYVSISLAMGSESDTRDGEDGDKTSIMEITPGGGVLYMLTDSIALNAGLFYNMRTEEQTMSGGVDVEDAESETTSIIGIQVGIAAFVF